MGCGASKRTKDDVLPLQALARDARQPQDLKEDKRIKHAEPEVQEDDIFTGANIDNLPNRKNKGFLELSNFSDLPEYQPDHPNLNFHNGELSPIDMNRDNSSKKMKNNAQSQHLVSFEQENANLFFGAQKSQGSKTGTKKEDALNWPDRGTMEIKTISYKVVYSHEIKGFRTLQPKDHYLTSLLSWQKNKEDIFEFSMKDTSYSDLRTGNSHEVFTPAILFDVQSDGKFLGIINLEKFVDSVLNIQNTGKITKTKHIQLEKKIATELEKTWNIMVREWKSKNKANYENSIVDTRNQFGKDCILLNKSKLSNDEECRKKLTDKLLDPSSYYKLLSSSKMLKDKFKKWELHKDSTPKSKNPYVVQDDAVTHRSLKLNFISTDKSEIMTVLNDLATSRPLMSSYENSKNIVFEVNKDIYIDVEYEAKMSIYLWKDVKDLHSDDFLISEMVKFQDSCDYALGEMLAEISKIPKIPLKFRLDGIGEGNRTLNMYDEKIDLSKVR